MKSVCKNKNSQPLEKSMNGRYYRLKPHKKQVWVSTINGNKKVSILIKFFHVLCGKKF